MKRFEVSVTLGVTTSLILVPCFQRQCFAQMLLYNETSYGVAYDRAGDRDTGVGDSSGGGGGGGGAKEIYDGSDLMLPPALFAHCALLFISYVGTIAGGISVLISLFVCFVVAIKDRWWECGEHDLGEEGDSMLSPGDSCRYIDECESFDERRSLNVDFAHQQNQEKIQMHRRLIRSYSYVQEELRRIAEERERKASVAQMKAVEAAQKAVEAAELAADAVEAVEKHPACISGGGGGGGTEELMTSIL